MAASFRPARWTGKELAAMAAPTTAVPRLQESRKIMARSRMLRCSKRWPERGGCLSRVSRAVRHGSRGLAIR